VKKDYNILIADRNPHVRKFLKREMLNEGYRVCLADSVQKILKWLYHNEAIDLLIIDPEMPDATEPFLMTYIRDHFPRLQIVVHAFASEQRDLPDFLHKARFVEKKGDSIEHLSQVAVNILEKKEPCSFNKD